jgi:exopolysaccharide biosynthesis polyprenyl glycosylphosphotransferase
MEKNSSGRPSVAVFGERVASGSHDQVQSYKSVDALAPHLNPDHVDAIRIWIRGLEGNTPQQILERSVSNLQADLQLFKLEDSSRSTMDRFVKRSVDVVGALTGLVLLSPLFAFITIIIKLSSPGPAFFTQERIGKGGDFFRIIKFRTMVTGAERLKGDLRSRNEMDGPAFKIKDDPRITRVGRVLRKYSLDELPQLVNVLMGDMSLVGPRPALPEEVLSWKMWQTRRLSVDQGLTCFWQVSGRNHISFDRWMEMDLQYIDQWSLWLDFALIIKTIWVVITGKGAY